MRRYERPTSKAQHNGLPSKGSIMHGVAYAAARANCASSLAVITFSAVHNGVTEKPPARYVRLNAHVEASAPPTKAAALREGSCRRSTSNGKAARVEEPTLSTLVRQSRENVYSECSSVEDCAARCGRIRSLLTGHPCPAAMPLRPTAVQRRRPPPQ